jgi:hypothetical protein
VLPLLRLVPDAVERVPILATTDDGVVGEVEGSKLPGVVAGGLQRELVLRTVAVALPVPEGQVGPVLGDGDVADLKVLVGVAGDAPVHDAFHLEQGQQQLGRQPCIKLHACHKVCARFIYRSIICCLSSLSMSKKSIEIEFITMLRPVMTMTTFWSPMVPNRNLRPNNNAKSETTIHKL